MGVNKNIDNRYFYISLIILAISLVFFIYNLTNSPIVTGKVTATANLTIAEVVSVNFSTSNITWAKGAVTVGAVAAQLDTSEGTVTGGNWTANSYGLVLENIGNQNVTIDLTFGKDAQYFIDGTNGTNIWNGDYRFNVTANETNSCSNSTTVTYGINMSSGYYLGRFMNTNSSTALRVCDNLFWEDTKDQIRIDLYLNISTNSSITGFVSDTITATATAV